MWNNHDLFTEEEEFENRESSIVIGKLLVVEGIAESINTCPFCELYFKEVGLNNMTSKDEAMYLLHFKEEHAVLISRTELKI